MQQLLLMNIYESNLTIYYNWVYMNYEYICGELSH